MRRYRQVHGGKIDRKWVYPTQSGGEDYLYSDPTKPVGEAQWVEKNFMSPMDSLAHDALTMIEAGDPRINRESKARSAWSRFLMSLMMRMPNDIETLKTSLNEEWLLRIPKLEQEYLKKKQPGGPATFAEYLESRGSKDFESWAISIAPKLIDHRLIGSMINNMRWFFRQVSGHSEFLTSDRPILTLYEFASQDSYIMLPIGPRRLFVAVNNIETQRLIERRESVEFVAGINRLIVGAAKEFVFACDDSHSEFVTEHFGKRPRTTMFEHLQRLRRKKREEASNAGRDS
ncbi:hypothetical protein X742_25055 [Mesorhizobium sp. LNHC232B00]|nr:hypothetical protein X742_25055 [Mesorhizobium sp. LNHC232B00]